MLKAFTYGIKAGMRQWRIAMIVYLFQLMLAITLGVQVYHVLEASIGNSLELDKLLGNYDHTVIRDLIHVHGASISPLLGQLRWLALIYLLFSVFINGGILHAVVVNEKRWMTFWKGGASWFFPFLKIAIFFLSLTAFVTASIWLPFMSWFLTSPEQLASEKVSVWLLVAMLILYAFLLMFLFIWSLTARFLMFDGNISTWQAIRKGLSECTRRYFSFQVLALLFLLLHMAIFFCYWLFNNPGVVPLWGLLLFIVFQQMVAYARILLRIMTYGGFYSVFTGVHSHRTVIRSSTV